MKKTPAPYEGFLGPSEQVSVGEAIPGVRPRIPGTRIEGHSEGIPVVARRGSRLN